MSIEREMIPDDTGVHPRNALVQAAAGASLLLEEYEHDLAAADGAEHKLVVMSANADLLASRLRGLVELILRPGPSR